MGAGAGFGEQGVAGAGGFVNKERDLIPLTVPEVRRLLASLIFAAVPTATHALDWPAWRRRHQHHAKRCHYRARGHDPP